MRNGPTNQENILLLNIHVPNNRASKIHEAKTERRNRQIHSESWTFQYSYNSEEVEEVDRRSARIQKT